MLSFYLMMLETPTDREKFEILYTKYRNLMYHIAYQILQHPENAEDCVHAAFLSVLDNFEKVGLVEDPKTRAFLAVITENKALDMIRKLKRELPMVEEINGITFSMPSDNSLSSALNALPRRYRTALLLRYYNGYTTKETAEILGLTHQAAMKLITRAKQALQNQIKKLEQE